MCPSAGVPECRSAEVHRYTERVRRVMWLHVAALWAIAVAQPLFELLGDNPEFFVAHRAGAADVVLLALTLAILLPFVLALAVWLIGRAGGAAHTTALGLVVGGLTGLLAMQLNVFRIAPPPPFKAPWE